jgi:hypothetical protein
MLLHFLSDVAGFGCTSSDNKKPAKPCGLQVFILLWFSSNPQLVPMVGFEPTRLASPPPQDGVSTNFTTSANISILKKPISFQQS